MSNFEYTENKTFKEINTSQISECCGSSLLDNRLMKLLGRKFGQEKFLNYILSNNGELFQLKDEWEKTKSKIRNRDDSVNLVLPKNMKKKFLPKSKNNKLELDSEDLHSIYDKVLNTINKMMKIFIKNSTKPKMEYLCFVGGFSKSKVLQNFITKNFTKNFEKKIIFSDRITSLNCISIGGCLIGKNPGLIKGRISKLTFGVEVVEPYDRIQHKKYGDGRRIIINGESFLNNTFKSIIKKGEEIPEDFSCTRTLIPKKLDENMLINLFSFSGTDLPRFVDDKNMKKLGQMVIDKNDLEKNINVVFNINGSRLIVKVWNSVSEKLKQIEISFEPTNLVLKGNEKEVNL